MGVLSRLLCQVKPGLFNQWSSEQLQLRKQVLRGIRQKRPVQKDGRMNLAPEQLIETPRESNMFPGLCKSYAFSLGLCGTIFTGAMISEYEKFRKQSQNNSIVNWANKSWNKLDGWREKQGELRQHLNQWWNGLSEGERLFWPICGLNAVVLACWHHPALQKFMFRYFCNNPAAQAVCWPLLLSTFSHYSLFHFGMNMYVLHSFCATACNVLGPEQLCAMYLSGGIVSSLISSTYKVALRSVGPSIGASGAIMALLGYFCCQFPQSQLGIAFVPNFTFSADSALKFILILDFTGIVLRWRLFDHAAHLGGALFGVFYANYGQYLWNQRQPFIKKWHDFRNEMEKRTKEQ